MGSNNWPRPTIGYINSCYAKDRCTHTQTGLWFNKWVIFFCLRYGRIILHHVLVMKGLNHFTQIFQSIFCIGPFIFVAFLLFSCLLMRRITESTSWRVGFNMMKVRFNVQICCQLCKPLFITKKWWKSDPDRLF